MFPSPLSFFKSLLCYHLCITKGSSVVGEDTALQTIDRRSHHHIVNQKDFRGSMEVIQQKFDRTDGSKCKNMFD
eukprot:7234899-Ditylum_brightwellii.AAC.1